MIEMRIKLFFRNKKNRLILVLLFVFSVIFHLHTNYLNNSFIKNEYEDINNLYYRLHGEMRSLQVDRQLAQGKDLENIEKKLAYFEYIDKLYPKLNSILEKSLGSKDALALDNIDYEQTLNKLEMGLLKAYEEGIVDDQILYIYGKTLNQIKIDTSFKTKALANGENIIVNKYYPSPLRRVNLFLSDYYIGILFLLNSLFFIDIFYRQISEGYYQILYFANKTRKEILINEILSTYFVVILLFFINVIGIFAVNIVNTDFGGDGPSYIWKIFSLAIKSEQFLTESIVKVIAVKLFTFSICLLLIALVFVLLNILLEDYQKSGLIVGLAIISSIYVSFYQINMDFLFYINPLFTLFYEKFYFQPNNFTFTYAIVLIGIYILIFYFLINLILSKYEFLEEHSDFRS